VIRGGAIGDFILTVPAIAALRRQFPEAYLEVLGYPHIVQLAVAAGLVDHAQSIEARKLAAFFAKNGQLAEELAQYFTDFDLIISYLYDPDGIFLENVRRCTPAQFITGSHRPEPGSKTHAAQLYLEPLKQLAIFDPDPVPRLRVGAPRSTAAGGLASKGGVTEPLRAPSLALHPGSGSERKNWPEEKWAQLIEHLMNATRLNLLLMGGEAEGERLQRLAAALPPCRCRVAQSLPLADLARLLAEVDAFVGHDSGISHLAAALGLRGIVLWGDTPEEVWRPPSPCVQILKHKHGLDQLPAETVFAQILQLGFAHDAAAKA
jgi:heptosyltransferase-3